MRFRRDFLIALLAVSGIAHSQASFTGRQSSIHYNYVYGGGPFVFQDDQLLQETTPDLSDTLGFDYDHSEAGTYLTHTWSGSAYFDVEHQYAIDGPANDFHRIDWSGHTVVGTTAGGDIGLASASCINPGNDLIVNFEVASPVEYRLNGELQFSVAGNTSYVFLQKFNGFNWEYVFLSWSLPNYMGPFDVSGTLEPGVYRIWGQLAGSAFGNQTTSETGNFTLRLAQKVSPANASIRFGALNAGSVANMASLDGQAFRVCKAFVPNVFVAPVDVDLTATTNLTTVSSLSYRQTAKMASAGSYTQTLTLFDYAQNVYSPVATRTDPINTVYSTKTLSVTTNPADFVSPAGLMKARYQIRQTGFAAVAVMCCDVDDAGWTVMP